VLPCKFFFDNFLAVQRANSLQKKSGENAEDLPFAFLIGARFWMSPTLVVMKHAGDQQQFGMRRGEFW
jgi:hypothetical protein